LVSNAVIISRYNPFNRSFFGTSVSFERVKGGPETKRVCEPCSRQQVIAEGFGFLGFFTNLFNQSSCLFGGFFVVFETRSCHVAQAGL
jgi:hypothetical protein